MTREKIDVLFDRLDKAMRSWGTSTIILMAIVAFCWMHGGPWVDAKAQSEKAIASAYERPVDETVKHGAVIAKLQSSHEQVSAEHRQFSELLKEIATILKGICEENRSKNRPAQPSTGTS
jgi:hypothetical protein